jgi:hypothetical protein
MVIKFRRMVEGSVYRASVWKCDGNTLFGKPRGRCEN